MRAGPPKKTELKGMLVWNDPDNHIGIHIPVFVYNGNAKAGFVEQHMYHRDCKNEGQVGYVYSCKGCLEAITYGDIEKYIDTPGGKISASKSELKDALGANTDSVEVMGPVALKDIPALLENESVGFGTLYQLRGFKANKNQPSTNVEGMLRMLLDALSANKQALLVKLPINMERYGLLFGNGTIHTLLYEEEMKEDMPMHFAEGEGYDKTKFADFKRFLKGLERTIDGPFNLDTIRERVEEVIASKTPVVPNSSEPAKSVSIADGMENLKFAFGEAQKEATKKTRARVKAS